MACYIHPDRDAVANCSVCGRPICSECYVEIGGSSYCKNCINTLMDSGSEKVNDESKTIENIEPITKPKTIPYDESSDEVNPNASEEIVAPVEKAPENYEPEYDYQTQYVESYGDEDSEDSYYENPASIPEPQGDYKEVVADKVFSKPSSDDLESKYEKYLDDIYYDEVEGRNVAPVNNRYEEPVYNEPRNVQYREPVNNRYAEPNYNSPRNQYGEPVYQDPYMDDDFIVPVHQQSRGRGQSYEEIKRKLDAENMRISGQRRYDDYPMDYDDYGRRGSPNSLDDIQRMHNPPIAKKDNSFTTVEIILTVILIILIIVVVFYIIYLFALSATYSSVIDAVMGLVQDPSLFINNLIH